MKKMMFNTKYGLEKAVIQRFKDMTRRDGTKIKLQYEIGLDVSHDSKGKLETLEEYAIRKSPYKVGEVIAIAQCYSDIPLEYLQLSKRSINLNVQNDGTLNGLVELPGWTNKMFVRADAMPHRIEITAIRYEQLRCISDEECLREGIIRRDDIINNNMENIVRYTFENSFERGVWKCYKTAREAFAALIDKISGNGYWESNPFVYVYSFKLIC